MSQVQATDPSKLDPLQQKAFQLAIDFYELDKDLTRDERDVLSKTYQTISYSTLFAGWSSFFAVTSIPFFRQKYKTGSSKGTNVGLAVLGGMAAMFFVSPWSSNKIYHHQLDKLQDQPRCQKVAEILKPAESTRWMIYYQLTKDHPEHIMKDPRSQAAAAQRAKTIYSGRDPLGLHSGPKYEISKGPSKQQQQQTAVSSSQDRDSGVVGNVGDDDTYDDPFELGNDRRENEYRSAWQKVRAQNGVKDEEITSSPNWSRIRSQPNTNASYTSTANAYKSPKTPDEQDEFDRLLEQERINSGDDENKKWE